MNILRTGPNLDTLKDFVELFYQSQLNYLFVRRWRLNPDCINVLLKMQTRHAYTGRHALIKQLPELDIFGILLLTTLLFLLQEAML